MKMIDNKDSIKHQLQAKFEDFQVVPPEDGWERIENSLFSAQKATPYILWRRVGIAAALAALIVGGILFTNYPERQPLQPTVVESGVSVASPDTDKNILSEATSSKAVSSVDTPRERHEINRFSEQKRESKTPPTLIVKEEIGKEIDWRQKKNADIEPQEERSQDLSGLNKNEKLTYSKEEAEHLIREFAAAAEQNNVDIVPSKHRRQDDFQLAMAGRSGVNAFQKTINAPMSLRSASVEFDKAKEQELKTLNALSSSNDVTEVKTNISEMEHAQPVSFGVTVSKEILDNVFLETGVIYTYLYSKAKNINPDYKKAETQHFHYLGVPLSINYRLMSFNDVGVYLSLGGMIEKDVYGEFRSVQHLDPNKVSETAQKKESSHIRQKHPQLSVNAGVGVSYPIYGKMQLYGKVGGSYYFDANNDYKTIYSDRKIMLDLNLGLRIGF